MPNRLVLKPGQRFGSLTLVRRAYHPLWNRFVWACRCDCGDIHLADTSHLKQGRTLRCRACSRVVRQERATKHGLQHIPEYRVWSVMRDRCVNPKCKSFPNYGGRGITVCERWRNSFVPFIEDMGRRPSRHHSIERINNDGPYSPDNCRWATKAEQSRNKRPNVWLEYNGTRLILKDVARLLGINQATLAERLKKWPLHRALQKKSTLA